MPLTIHWSDCLEKLAETMFAQPAAVADPFAVEGVVVGGAVIEGWLKQRYLLDRPAGGRARPLLANCEFVPLHPFVNDWLAKAVEGTPLGRRDPSSHPYSKGVLQWRVYGLLQADPARFAPLARYVGDNAQAADRRRWGLAGKLAQLFDDYQNYRPDMLAAWRAGRPCGDGDSGQAWQAELWRVLLAEHPRSYVDEFLEIKCAGLLRASGIDRRYRRLSVFHVSAMPKAYFDFFAEIAKLIPVSLYCFNPSRAFWIDDPTVKGYLRELARSGEAPIWMEPPHPLLNGFGRGAQAFLADVVDWVEGQVNEDAWGDDDDATLLRQVQRGIRDQDARAEDPALRDASIQLHACHGAMREAQVARDLILAWFEAHPESEPRDVQVLVADFETYAPFIESVFRVGDPGAIPPCVMSRRPAIGAGAVGAAFIRLLHLAESRMTAPEIMALLELDPVREAYGLSIADAQALRRRVAEAGVRWGADGDHVTRLLGRDGAPDTVTWRRGLDRLLAGWAHGRGDAGEDDGALIDAGALGRLLAADAVEGDAALHVGVLGQFFDDLCETAEALLRPRRASAWRDRLTALLDTFFRSTESSFQAIAEIRRAIRTAGDAAAIAGDPTIPGDVIAAAVEAELGGMAASGNCAANAVLFAPLQTLQPTPRRLLVMMGLNEGVFPRPDNRADFDLLGRHPRPGDRSLRREDRLAFLEALMCARDRLVITYTGRNIADNARIPPSPAVTELLQHLGDRVETTEHRLYAFHPDYFSGAGALRSFSKADYAAAAALAAKSRTGATSEAPREATAPPTPVALDDEARQLTLEDLAWFFANPAQSFYTQILQARLDEPTKDRLADSECFVLDKLEEYQVNQCLIGALLDADGAEPGDAVFVELQERTMIPLGPAGIAQARAQFEGVRKQIEAVSKEIGIPYLTLLRQLRNTEKAPVRVAVGRHEVSGGISLLHCNGRDFAIHFHFATLKPKRMAQAWISHLAGHAAGLRFTSVLIGKDGGKMEEVVMPPLEPATAARILGELLALYDEGQANALPFAPASSLAYAKAMRPKPPKKPKKGEMPAAPVMPTEADGRAAAAKAWAAFVGAEGGDRYLKAVWGDAGPMAHPDFDRVATTFWTPLLDAQAGGEGGAA